MPGDIGVDEIVTLEEQGMIGRHRERVGEAVADVQSGSMAAPAEAAKRVDSDVGLLRRDADNIEAAIAEQKVEVRTAGLALAALDDEGKLNPRHRREQAHRCVAESARKPLCIGFPQQDRDKRRSIDDLQRHIPVSS